MTGPTEAGVGIVFRPGGLGAWLRLLRTTVDALEAGRGVPCVSDPAPYTSDDRNERAEAAVACRACPVLLDCATSALINEEPVGVWGGVDLTPSQGAGAVARRARLAALLDGDDIVPGAKGPLPRRCAECGEMFTPKRRHARSCSNACRLRSSRRARRALDAAGEVA